MKVLTFSKPDLKMLKKTFLLEFFFCHKYHFSRVTRADCYDGWSRYIFSFSSAAFMSRKKRKKWMKFMHNECRRIDKGKKEDRIWMYWINLRLRVIAFSTMHALNSIKTNIVASSSFNWQLILFSLGWTSRWVLIRDRTILNRFYSRPYWMS